MLAEVDIASALNVVLSKTYLDGISVAQLPWRAAANEHMVEKDVQDEFLGTVLA
jgi:hypothetical protein